MKIVNISKVPKEEAENWTLFTGKVFKQLPVKGADITADYIYFPKGIRNKLHSHTTDQILIVTQGIGVVATEKEKFILKEGDVIYIPAGEKHWHGAGPDSDFTHISINRAGSQITQFEK